MESELITFPYGIINNIKFWCLNGECHREDGPAVEWPNGLREWFLNGKRHREDGPAIEFPTGHREWFLNGKRHREDGPAIEFPTGHREWWTNGVQLSEEDLLDEQLKIEYSNLYNTHLVYYIMGC